MPSEFFTKLGKRKMDIRSILLKLIALGPKLPEVMEQVENIIAAVSAIVAIVSGEQKMFGACPMDAGEQALCEQAENELQLMQAGPGTFAAERGSRIANLLAFLKEHPELVALVLKLIGG